MAEHNLSQLEFDHCAFCDESSDLQSSHIIPAFVFNWLRETSATGRFRFSQSPNLRVQDGWKPRMLCRDCEQIFSSWEKKFSEDCFVPLNSGRTREIVYGPWMLKFATSVSWRVLRACIADGHLSGFPDHIMTHVNNALQEWSRFLQGIKPNPGPYEQHMFIVDAVAGATIANTPPNISRYWSRAIELRVDRTRDSAITYAKMGRFVLFGFIGMTNPRRWKGTKLRVRHGTFGQHDIELPKEIFEFFSERARLTAGHYSKISERQQAKVRESYERDINRAVQSETLRALHHDVLMFGKNAFEATQSKARVSNAKDEN